MDTPTHPGQYLLEVYMRPLGLTPVTLAERMGVSVGRLSDLIASGRGLTAPTALRLAAVFDTSPELWLNLQLRHDLALAEERYGAKVRREVVSFAKTSW